MSLSLLHYSKIAINNVVLANRYSDVWDKATITEIQMHQLVEEVCPYLSRDAR